MEYKKFMSNALLHYKICSERKNQLSHTKPIIVLIHCFATSSSLFVKQIQYLKPNYDLVLIDLPSHGKSEIQLTDLENDYSSVTNEIIKVLDVLNIKKAHFVGCSLGTFFLKHILLYHKERVDKSIMLGCVGKYSFLHSFILKWGNSLIRILPYKLFCQIIATVVMPSKISKRVKELFIRCCLKFPKTEFRAYINLFKKYPKLNKEYLKNLYAKELDTSKILYISGSRDLVFLPTITEELKEIENSYMINNCGHLCNFDQDKKVNRLIKMFLENN